MLRHFALRNTVINTIVCYGSDSGLSTNYCTHFMKNCARAKSSNGRTLRSDRSFSVHHPSFTLNVHGYNNDSSLTQYRCVKFRWCCCRMGAIGSANSSLFSDSICTPSNTRSNNPNNVSNKHWRQKRVNTVHLRAIRECVRTNGLAVHRQGIW